MSEIEVSVCCIAYNHEKYIRDALEGFVNQKTNFRYEVLVHDDASTDKTAKIIEEYEEKYPDIIKAIYQKENQFSQGINIWETYIYPNVRGRYIALCEGDDCWIDENKLQRQYDALENHPECDMCAHRSKMLDCLKNSIAKEFPAIYEYRVLRVEEVIYGEGGFLPTASLFFHKDIRMNPMNFQKIWNIDYSLQIRGALRGGIVFIPETMALYRWQTEGSWTSRNSNLEAQVALYDKKKTMLMELNKETSGRYQEIINKRLKKNEFNKLILIGNYKGVLSKENKCFLQELSLREQLKLYIKGYFPVVDRLYQTIKGRKR